MAVGDDNQEFMEYPGGLYEGKCGGTKNDHALLLVGYGSYYYLRSSGIRTDHTGETMATCSCPAIGAVACWKRVALTLR